MLFLRRLRYILQSRYYIKILSIILIFISIIYSTNYTYKSKYNKNDTTFIGIVDSFELKEDKLILTIIGKEKLIIYYNYDDKVFNNLSYGDKIKVEGKLKVPSSTTIFNTFDYQKYLYHKGVFYIVNASSIEKIGNNKNYLYTVKNILYERINKLKSSSYIKTLVLGNNTLSTEVNSSFRILGISHLFSISGMHISLIIFLITKYLDRITYLKKVKYIIVDIILILYLIIVNTSSLLRSVSSYILFSINNIFNLNIKKLDITLLTLSILLIIKPNLIYDIGFIYSYTISFFLINFRSKYKKKYQKIIYITLLSFLVSFPITVSLNYEVNILSILVNIILVPIVSTIIFPLCLITLIFPIFDDLLYLFTVNLEKISLSISKISFMKIILSKPSVIVIIIYYILIIVIIYKHKYIYLFVIMVFIHHNINFLNPNFNLTMIDVGQGDCFLIRYPYNKGNILVDTGSEDNYRVTNQLIPYFKSIGLTKIDYLVTSHGDEDHLGSASILINNFKVDNIVLNKGSASELEKDLVKLAKEKNIHYSNEINDIKVGNRKIYFLDTNNYDNENDNSNIMYFKYKNYSFLFMGDASFKVEDNLIKEYNLSNISFLKVGHHGSNTSSNYDFIKSINPKVSLISVGENNSYGHPNKEVLSNLSKSKIYRTDLNGSVNIKINTNNKVKIKKYIKEVK